MPQQHRKGFSWIPSQKTLKTKTNLINLQQNVAPNQGPVHLRIDTERELQYTSELGWNWHKSWNIPNISVKIFIEKEETTQWSNCYVQLLAVKVLSTQIFEEVGLEGITQQEIVDGKAFFSGVKFNSTTYNHQGHRFHLLILLKERNNIIVALQSPPIFVDSRKSARDEHRQIQYIQPFEPKYLERSFCKKEKHFNDIVDAPIENNENGLHNYLTAPNIRNKIKHPLFMALKFSKCLNIYYLNSFITDNYLVEFQKQLMSKQTQSEYVIVFQSNNNRIRKKIEESLTQLFAQSKVQVIEKKNLNELLYKKLEFSENDYINVYSTLIELMSHFTMETQIEMELQPKQQQSISEEDNQLCHQSLLHSDKKSAFKKYKDFDKLPTKNFGEISEEQQEQQHLIEKQNNIKQIENYENLKKQIKIEEEQQQQQQLLSLKLQTQPMTNQFNQFNNNYQLLMQQKFQEQLLQYYFIQQQLMLCQFRPQI